MRDIRFIWVCRNIHFNKIERVELTDDMFVSGKFPLWIKSSNCGIIAKILPTGLKDKNGKDIFEGDIIRNENGRIMAVFYRTDKDTAEWAGDVLAGSADVYGSFKASQSEVIGDIYNNPGLLIRGSK